MIVVNRIEDNINVSCRDKEYNVMYSSEKFEELLEISEESLTVKSMAELTDLLDEVEKICTESLTEQIEAFHKELTYNPVSKEYFLKLNGTICNIPIPKAMVWRLEESIDKKIDVSPLIKNLKLVLRNRKMLEGGIIAKEFFARYCEYINMTYVDPSKVNALMDEGLSEDIASEKARTYEVKITQEGLIACFKTSNEILTKYEKDENGNIVEVNRYSNNVTKFNADTGEIEEVEDTKDSTKGEDRVFTPYMMRNTGDAFYCEGLNGYDKPGHFIKIGCTHRLPNWTYVNCDDKQSCVKGLHLGGLSYIATWGGADIHTCFVDPSHIGAIPDYSSDKAIRVIQYYVYGSLVTIDHNIYHSSEYAKQTEDEWNVINEELLELYSDYKDEIKETVKYIKAI